MEGLLKEINAHSTETKRRLAAVSCEHSDNWGRKQRRVARRMGFEALHTTTLFQNTATSTLKMLAKHFKPISYRAGEYIIEQGDIGKRFLL